MPVGDGAKRTLTSEPELVTAAESSRAARPPRADYRLSRPGDRGEHQHRHDAQRGHRPAQPEALGQQRRQPAGRAPRPGPDALVSDTARPLRPGRLPYSSAWSTGYQGAVAMVSAASTTSLRPRPGTSRNAGNSDQRQPRCSPGCTRLLSRRASTRIRITSPARPAPRRTATPSAATGGRDVHDRDQVQGQERGEHVQQQVRDLEQHEPAQGARAANDRDSCSPARPAESVFARAAGVVAWPARSSPAAGGAATRFPASDRGPSTASAAPGSRRCTGDEDEGQPPACRLRPERPRPGPGRSPRRSSPPASTEPCAAPAGLAPSPSARPESG